MTRALLLFVSVLAACDSPLATCTDGAGLLGRWQYSGRQDAPVAANLSGVLEVTGESCENFEGRLDVIESNGSGAAVRLAGPVTGRRVGDGSIRFDAFLGPLARQHLASLGSGAADGSWVVTASGATPASTGTFQLTRETVR